MNPNDYQKACLRTAGYALHGFGLNQEETHCPMAVSALGLTGETGEIGKLMEPWNQGYRYQSLELKKELGDIAWYVAVMSWQIDKLLSDYPTVTGGANYFEYEFARLVSSTGAIADHVKKVIGHGHKEDYPLLRANLEKTWIAIQRLAICASLDFNEILEANIKKLKERYPNGFTTEASLNRKD